MVLLAGRQSPLRRGMDMLQWPPFSGGVAVETIVRTRPREVARIS